MTLGAAPLPPISAGLLVFIEILVQTMRPKRVLSGSRPLSPVRARAGVWVLACVCVRACITFDKRVTVTDSRCQTVALILVISATTVAQKVLRCCCYKWFYDDATSENKNAVHACPTLFECCLIFHWSEQNKSSFSSKRVFHSRRAIVRTM